jgi:hypothetical protein
MITIGMEQVVVSIFFEFLNIEIKCKYKNIALCSYGSLPGNVCPCGICQNNLTCNSDQKICE